MSRQIWKSLLVVVLAMSPSRSVNEERQPLHELPSYQETALLDTSIDDAVFRRYQTELTAGNVVHRRQFAAMVDRLRPLSFDGTTPWDGLVRKSR